MRAFRGLTPGSDAWVAAKLATWPPQWEALKRKLSASRPRPSRKRPAWRKQRKWLPTRMRTPAGAWPHVTTECMATDRMYFHGMKNATRLMTGYVDVGQGPLVSYRGLGGTSPPSCCKPTPPTSVSSSIAWTTNPKTPAWRVASRQGDEFELTLGPDEQRRPPDSVTESHSAWSLSAEDIPFESPAVRNWPSKSAESRKAKSP